MGRTFIRDCGTRPYEDARSAPPRRGGVTAASAQASRESRDRVPLPPARPAVPGPIRESRPYKALSACCTGNQALYDLRNGFRVAQADFLSQASRRKGDLLRQLVATVQHVTWAGRIAFRSIGTSRSQAGKR